MLLSFGSSLWGWNVRFSGLVWDTIHIQVLAAGEVLLFPDPVFLAKTDLPTKRWGPWRIPLLREEPSLCPMKCLESYLAESTRYESDQLFLGEEGSKLTLKQLMAKSLYFIKLADPYSVPGGHEVRKIASSMNFFDFMVGNPQGFSLDITSGYLRDLDTMLWPPE